MIARLPLIFIVLLFGGCARAQSPGSTSQPAAATSQPASTPIYRAGRAATAPSIDGKLDDAAWSRAQWTSDLVNILGADHPAPPWRTRCRMLWDDAHLYMAVELLDGDVRAAMRNNGDPLFKENCFELFVDPDGDGRDYWEIEINALATTWDLCMSRPYRSGGRPIKGKRLKNLRAAVNVQGTINDASDTDRGWTIEMAIPFSDLGVTPPRPPRGPPPRPGDTWRVNLARIHYTNKIPQFSSWAVMGEENYHRPEKFGWVQFTDD